MSPGDLEPERLPSALAHLTPASQEKWDTFSAVYRERQKKADEAKMFSKSVAAHVGCSELSWTDPFHHVVTRSLVIGAHHLAALEGKDVYTTLTNPFGMLRVVEHFTKRHDVPTRLSLHFTYAMGRAEPMEALKQCLTYVLLSYENPSIMWDFSQFQWVVAQKKSDTCLDVLLENDLKELLRGLCGHRPWQRGVDLRHAAIKGDMGDLYPAWTLKWKICVKEVVKRDVMTSPMALSQAGTPPKVGLPMDETAAPEA